jgi:hypothetical protein
MQHQCILIHTIVKHPFKLPVVISATVRSGNQSVVCEQASFLLGEVLGEHPGMKLIVAREVERFMFRPGLAERALYYAIVFLNQMILTRRADQGMSLILHAAHCSNKHFVGHTVQFLWAVVLNTVKPMQCVVVLAWGASKRCAHWEAATLNPNPKS